VPVRFAGAQVVFEKEKVALEKERKRVMLMKRLTLSWLNMVDVEYQFVFLGRRLCLWI